MEIKKFEYVNAEKLHKVLSTSTPFMEGFFAYREKIGEEDNPYKFGTENYWAWRHGWYQAKKEDEGPFWRNKYVINGIILLAIAAVTVLADFFPASPMITSFVVACYGIASILLRNAFVVNIRAPVKPMYESPHENSTESAKTNSQA